MTAQEFVNKKLGGKNYTHSKYPIYRAELENWLNEFAEQQVELLAPPAVSKNEVAGDCTTCKYNNVQPVEDPCWDCYHYSKWVQATVC